MKWIPFNSNGYVRVRLTDRGRQLIRRNIKQLETYAPHINWKFLMPVEDADGWSEWQLWQLMETFGNYVGNGQELVFEPNIEISGDGLPGKPSLFDLAELESAEVAEEMFEGVGA